VVTLWFQSPHFSNNRTQINVYSSDGTTLVNSFSSARKAAEYFNLTKERILKYTRNGKLFLDKGIFSTGPKNKL
jgi:hypothetical protein